MSAVVARARALLGVRFRPHGRGAEGLDCVGLAAAAFGVSGVPQGYALRGGSAAVLAETVAALGLVPAAAPAPGDLVLLASGPGALHLAIASEDGLIHADAGLGRVVERPGAPPWPVLARWRRPEEG